MIVISVTGCALWLSTKNFAKSVHKYMLSTVCLQIVCIIWQRMAENVH